MSLHDLLLPSASESPTFTCCRSLARLRSILPFLHFYLVTLILSRTRSFCDDDLQCVSLVTNLYWEAYNIGRILNFINTLYFQVFHSDPSYFTWSYTWLHRQPSNTKTCKSLYLPNCWVVIGTNLLYTEQLKMCGYNGYHCTASLCLTRPLSLCPYKLVSFTQGTISPFCYRSMI